MNFKHKYVFLFPGLFVLIGILIFPLSFGFSSTLRAATSGQAFPQCVFDHWDMMSSDPLEPGSQAANHVAEIRKRKGLKEQMTPLSEYEDKL